MSKKHSTRKHSKYAASNAKRIMACPACVPLSEGIESKDSDASKEGTEAHEWLEKLVLKKCKLSDVPEKFRAHLKDSLAAIKYFEKPGMELITEQRVSLAHIDPDAFGTLDYSVLDLWGTLVVIDFKYGRYPVMPIEDDDKPNPQLMYYAAAVAHEHGYDFEKVKLVVIQPKIHRGKDLPYYAADFSMRVLNEWEKEFKQAIEFSKMPNPPINPGKHCKFCPAEETCPARKEQAEAAEDTIAALKEVKKAIPVLDRSNAKTLGDALRAADLIESWCKKIREQVFLFANAGDKVDGYKLVERRASRKWKKEAEKLALKLFGDKAFKKEFLTVAQLEKLGKPYKNFIEKYSVRESSGFTLAPDADSRREIGSELVDFTLID